MKKFILVMMMILGGMIGAFAQDVNEQAMIDEAVLAADTIEPIDPAQAEQDSMLRAQQQDPEWYVAPIPYDSVMRARRAPRRAAAGCQIDSVQTFNEAGVLIAVTMYEYGDTTRTMTWAINPDGSRVGQSRTESGTNGNITFSASYEWNNATNNWRGISKEEHVYENNKEVTRILYNTWQNNAWVADTKYTWVYDAAGRIIEFITYSRVGDNLVPITGLFQEWYNASKKNYEINYTAYTNGAWSAGNKKEYAYDTNGNQIEYTYYSSYNNGNWVGSTHELWTYTSGKKNYYEKQTWSNGAWVNSYKENWEYNGPSSKQTYYEKQTWTNGAWVSTAQELWTFANGLQISHKKYSNSVITASDSTAYDDNKRSVYVENYTYTNGVSKGSKKEKYAYFGTTTKKTFTVTYSWTNNAWVNKDSTVNDYDAALNTTEASKYTWNNNAWVGSGNRTETEYVGGKKSAVLTSSWDATAADWKYSNSHAYAYDNSGRTIGDTTKVYTDSEWINKSLITHAFDVKGNDTLSVTSNWNGAEWEATSIIKGTYTYLPSGKPLLVETYKGLEDNWIGTQKIEYVYDEAERQTKYTLYEWRNGTWGIKTLTEHAYDEGGRTILNQSYSWTNGALAGSYKYEYLFDAAGNSLKSAQYIWSGGWYGLSRTDNGYSEQGEHLYTISFRWRNGDWEYKQKTEFVRDSQGRLIDKKILSYQSGAWVNTQWNTYTFDSRGQEISAWEYAWDGNQWLPVSRSEKTYDESDNKLRREILGSWDNGITLSYTDNLYFYNVDFPLHTIRFENYDGTLLESMELRETKTPVYTGETPTRPATAQYTYTFTGWDKEIAKVTADATYTAQFDSVLNQFTITFNNYNGSELQTIPGAYGVIPNYTGETPNKPATAQYTFSFIGWDKELVAVTADATYTAKFDSIVNKYTITWLNDDDTEIDHTLVEYGVVPTHADAVKANTAEWTYAFTGWDITPVSVTGEATYKATFSATKNSYTITWLMDDDSQIDQTTVEYGVVPTHADAEKANTAEWTYAFTGWDVTPVSVTGEATYKATFSSTKNSYTVTWLMDDDTEIDHASIEYGVVPTHADAEKTNTAEWTYAFTGWDKEVVAVTGDATYKATFSSTKNSYTITWLNADNSPIDQNTLEYGATPTHADAEKTNTAEWSYSFIGWSPEIASVTGNAVYTAQFDSVRNSYTITWRNADGSELSHETLEYGSMPTHADPMKPANAQYTYTFAGWTPAIESVTGNAVYTARFDSIVNTYTVIFYDEDGTTELDRATVAYGNTPQYTGGTPNKQATAEYTYAFNGWSPELVAVTGDANYMAVYSATTNEYTVTFKNGDEVLQSNVIAYGLTPSYNGNDPIKIANAEWNYTFAGWSPEIVSVTGEATYTARFDSVRNSYTVIWLSDDGSELDRATLEYGTMPQYAGGTPMKPATAEYTFTFLGWTPSVEAVTGNAVYTARFDSVVNTYTVIFYYEDGYTELDRHTYTYGEIPSTDYVPSLPSTPQYTYVFTGWSPELSPVTGDASYVAQFDTIVNEYAITFVNYDGTVLQRSQVDYGTLPVYEGAEPEKPANAQYHYVFSGWSPQLATVTRDATYTAQFASELNTFVVIFYDEDGVTELDRVEVAYGKVPTTTVIPTKAEDEEYTYTFAGWSPRIVAATSDASYVATYTATPKHNGLDAVESAAPAKKIFRNGQIYILRAGKVYSADGVLVE